MKKLGLTVFTVICAIGMALCVMVMVNANTVSADPAAVTLSVTKIKKSTAKDKLLLVTAIKNYENVYEVGYTGIDEGDKISAVTNKYYTEISTGTKTWDAEEIFGNEYDGAGLIVWEIEYSPASAYTYQAYAKYGTREGDVLVKNDPETSVTATERTTGVEQYTVTIDMDGGALSDGVDDDIDELVVPYGTQASALDAYTATKAGYAFSKWQYFNGANYVDLPANAEVTEDITIKAVWTVDYVMSLNVATATLYNDTTAGTGSFDSVAGISGTQTVTPSLSVIPAETVNYSYESDHTDVANVTNAGVISAVGAGSATITVTATDSNTGETQQETVAVTVKDYCEITTKAEFTAAIRSEADKYFLLKTDLTYGNADYADTNGGNHDDYLFYTSDGRAASIFGTLDGNGHTLTISRGAGTYEYYRSTFYWIVGTVKNLYFDFTIENNKPLGSGYGSAFAYRVHDTGLVENCVIAYDFALIAGTGDIGAFELILGTVKNCVTYAKTTVLPRIVSKQIADGAAVENIVHVGAYMASYGSSYGFFLPVENAGTITNVAWYTSFANAVSGSAEVLNEAAYAEGYATSKNSSSYWTPNNNLLASSVVSGFTFTNEGVSFS